MGLVNLSYSLVKKIINWSKKKSNLTDKYQIEDRRKGRSAAVIILAGYKPPLWKFVFPRLKVATSEMEIDICITSAGKYELELSKICEKNSWTYLATETNDVSLVQNIAIKLHPSAIHVVKVDEDMFVMPDTIDRVISCYKEIKLSGVVDPAFVAPMINVNGVCYRPLLKTLGILESFESEFGVARIKTLGTPLTDDPRAARWMWKATTPLEETAAKLKANIDRELLLAPVQFSIGLIVFERAFWEEIGYFPVKRHLLAMKKSTLGADEEYICRMAMFYGRPAVVCQDAFVGHFAFGRQYVGMLELLESNPEYFSGE